MNHITIERQVGMPRTRHIKVFVEKNLRAGSKDKNTEITAEIPAVKDVQSMLKIAIIIFTSFYKFLKLL